MRQIMRSSLDYAGFAQLCGRSPIMREIMRAHNRIIPRSLLSSLSVYQKVVGTILTITTGRETRWNRLDIVNDFDPEFRAFRALKWDVLVDGFLTVGLRTAVSPIATVFYMRIGAWYCVQLALYSRR